MALFGRRQVSAQVTGMTWHRVVQMERQQWESRRGTYVPSTSETRNVEHHTEQFLATVTNVMAAQTDPGGNPVSPASKPRQELQTRAYVTYEELVWRKGRTLTAKGSDPGEVFWPDDAPQPGERVRSRKESYQVTFAADGKSHETSLPEREWRALHPGGHYQLTLGLLGGVKKVAEG